MVQIAESRAMGGQQDANAKVGMSPGKLLRRRSSY